MIMISYQRAHLLLAMSVVLLAGCDQGSASSRTAEAATPAVSPETELLTPSEPAVFAGSWEAVSDDGTNIEAAELAVAGYVVTGTIRTLERGY